MFNNKLEKELKEQISNLINVSKKELLCVSMYLLFIMLL